MADHREIEEHVHHARNPFDKIVAATMAIVAAFLAVVSVLGQHYNTEQILRQQQSSDQWAYYEAKDIRRYTAQVAQDAFAQANGPAHQAFAKYMQDAAKYRQQGTQIEDHARELEKERDREGNRAGRFHIGEVFLELAIVLSSLAILTKNWAFYAGGLLAAAAGIVTAATAYLV